MLESTWFSLSKRSNYAKEYYYPRVPNTDLFGCLFRTSVCPCRCDTPFLTEAACNNMSCVSLKVNLILESDFHPSIVQCSTARNLEWLRLKIK
uniref:AlNc14C58G4327 protein n=1 Tax=Albugo laibachii Nc14 TaxID=890382 RepID=F0WCE7_9STRA|nr:AlNc14C58G4327 [Albugo laibachii Nc14]|eukprot:CCA18862.1 AlNc14C58G4327 [Albugo laibachii Nc14]